VAKLPFTTVAFGEALAPDGATLMAGWFDFSLRLLTFLFYLSLLIVKARLRLYRP